MSFTAAIDRAYQSTRATDNLVECADALCNALVDRDKADTCEICGEFFCARHLEDGICESCAGHFGWQGARTRLMWPKGPEAA